MSKPQPKPVAAKERPMFNGNPTNYRYTVTFAKHGPARFLGHLDLQTLFHRALNRAKLPAAYSSGFNPHLLISFAQPLPLGMTSYVELLDIEMDETAAPEDIVKGLNASLPDGIEVLAAELMPLGSKSMASLMSGALYEIEFPESAALRNGFAEAVQWALGSDSIVIEKKSKRGTAQADIRPDICALKDISDEKRIAAAAILATGSYRNLKPEFVARLLCERCGADFSPYTVRYARKKLYLNGLDGKIGDESDIG